MDTSKLSEQYLIWGVPTDEDRKILRYKFHTHKCQCGNCWKHSELKAGSKKAHTCLKCGREVFRRVMKADGRNAKVCSAPGVNNVLSRNDSGDQPTGSPSGVDYEGLLVEINRIFGPFGAEIFGVSD